jgi:malonyl-CoA decarboxylase
MFETEVTMIPNDLTSSGLSGAKPASLERAELLAATLLSERGEASGALVARQLHDALGALDASDRHRFRRYLATEFQPDKAALRAAAERYLAEGTAGLRPCSRRPPIRPGRNCCGG